MLSKLNDDEGAESYYSGLGSTDDEATGPVIIKAATVEAEAKPGQETSKRKALGQSIYFCKWDCELYIIQSLCIFISESIVYYVGTSSSWQGICV